MAPNPHTQKTLTVEGLGQNGDGVVMMEGQRLYIPYAAPEDEVFLTLSLTKKNRYQVFSHEIIKRGATYSPPPCPHYGVCGSCQLQHLNNEAYRQFKRAKILNPLKFEGLEALQSFVKEPLVLPPGLRRRANFNFRCRADGVELGYHKYHSYELLNLKSCHILKPEIVAFMQPLLKVLGDSFAPGLEGEVFITAAHNGLDVQVEVRDRAPLDLSQRERWGQFANYENLCRLEVCIKGKPDFILVRETPYVLFDGVPVESHCRGFLQPSQEADQALATIVRDFLPSTCGKIADLFCGRGTLSFPLSRSATVEGYEMDELALAALNKAARKTQRPIEGFYRDLFKTPLTDKELKAFDVVVIDPPRAGAENQIRYLAASSVSTLIYVSCNPLTFARDARLLIEGGYTLDALSLLDQFRWTVHVEVVARFLKK